ncbi:hypothetical protein JD969_18695 [Planctomycetota bacterium]|nr:hypothetical protein JD969_18695 [Planctomycetota bacterium]
MSDQIAVMEVERSGELVLKVGEEMHWLWGVNGDEGGKYEVLGWVEVKSADLWEVGVWLWPEVVVLAGSLMGLVACVYLWRWMRLRRKLRDVKVGEGYCRGCGYVLHLDDEEYRAVTCAECGKRVKVGKIKVRKWWQVRWASFVVVLMVMLLSWGGASVVGVSAWKAMKAHKWKQAYYGEWRNTTWWDADKYEVKDWFNLPSAKFYQWMMGSGKRWRGLVSPSHNSVHHELWGMWFDEQSGEVKKNVLAREYASEAYYEVIDGERRMFELVSDNREGLLPRFIRFDGGYLLTLGQRLYWYDESNGGLEKIEMVKGGALPETNMVGTRTYDLGNGFVAIMGMIREDFGSDKAYEAAGKRTDSEFGRVVVVDAVEKKVVNEQNFIVSREGESLDDAQCEPMKIGRDGKVFYDGLCVRVSGRVHYSKDYRWGIVDDDGIWDGLELEEMHSESFEELPKRGWKRKSDFNFGDGMKIVDQRTADFTRRHLGELESVVPMQGNITEMGLTKKQEEERARNVKGVLNRYGGIAWPGEYDREKWAMQAIVSKDDASEGRFFALKMGELGRNQWTRGWLAVDKKNKRVWLSRFAWMYDSYEGWVKVYEIDEE